MLRLFALLFFLIAYIRIYFGIDFTDESYYVGMSYLFKMGQSPFVDEILPHQTTALLLVPFVHIFHFFSSENTGIMLYFRHIFFAFHCVFSYFIYVQFKKKFSIKTACLAALIFLLYTPFSIYLLNYNSVGSVFFAFVLYLMTFEQLNTKNIIFLSFCSGICTLTYPSFSIPLFAVFAAYLINPKNITKNKIKLCISLLFFAFAFFIFISSFGIQNIQNFLEINSSVNIWGGGSDKLSHLLEQFMTRPWIYLLAIVFSIVAMSRFIPWGNLVAYLVCANLLVYFYFSPKSFYTDLILPFFLVCASLCLSYVEWVDKELKKQAVFFFLVGLTSGLITAYTSANGLINFGIGAYAALLFFIGLIYHLLEKRNLKYASLFFSIAIFTPLLWYCFFISYRDTSPLRMRATISDPSPFWGITTWEGKKTLHDSLNTAIHNVLDNYKSDQSATVFFYDFPAGYLFTQIKARTNATWLMPFSTLPVKSQTYSDYFTKKGLPTTAFFFVWRNLQPNFVIDYEPIVYENDPLHSFLDFNYKNKIAAAPWLMIYQQKP